MPSIEIHRVSSASAIAAARDLIRAHIEAHASTAMAIAAAIIVLQIPLSAWCMSRYRFGPIEWVWRRLTYGRPL